MSDPRTLRVWTVECSWAGLRARSANEALQAAEHLEPDYIRVYEGESRPWPAVDGDVEQWAKDQAIQAATAREDAQ